MSNSLIHSLTPVLVNLIAVEVEKSDSGFLVLRNKHIPKVANSDLPKKFSIELKYLRKQNNSAVSVVPLALAMFF